MSAKPALQVREAGPGELTAQPLDELPQFNWLFLLLLIVCGILVLFFLFYFNRLFATVLSYAIRAYTWHYYRIYVDIHSLQISLLGGRVFFKGFRYHGENETVLVQSGYLTWKYWLRSAKPPGLFRDDEVLPQQSERESKRSHDKDGGGHTEEPSAKENHLPCRMELSLQGLEWFIYNRSAGYDSILAGFPQPGHNDDDNQRDHGKGDVEDSSSYHASSSMPNPQAADDLENDKSGFSSKPNTFPEKNPPAIELSMQRLARVLTSSDRPPSVEKNVDNDEPPSSLLRVLPLYIDCNKGAVVIGNENTKSILTSTWEKATGEVDIDKSGPLDKYKQVFTFDFSHPVVQVKPNPDFKHSQLAAARATTPDTEIHQGSRKGYLRWKYIRQKRRMWHSVRDLIPFFQRSVESFHRTMGADNAPQASSQTAAGWHGEERWAGLRRYLDEEEQDEHEGWNAVEYGRFSTILDCPNLVACYHWDIPGTVPTEQNLANPSVHQEIQDANGAAPPEWGLRLTLKEGGMINYGPWADRQRASFQSILFPNPRRNAHPAAPLTPGQPRRSTKFKLTVNMSQATTLRIPTKESSKDWQWKGRVEAVKGSAKLRKKQDKNHPRGADTDRSSHGPDIRPFGWFSLLMDSGSTIQYEMDMFASCKGYQNRLNFHLQGSKMTSSINHDILWQSAQQTISCDLFNPLEWNSRHDWNFKIESQGIDVFLLRDHVYLLTDMVSDWTSGPNNDFHVFVPFKYNIGFSLEGFRLFFNLNDSNIVNNPADIDDNAFLVINGKSLLSSVGIPMLNYRPKRKSVTFDMNIIDGLLELATPLWNTQRTFMEDKSVGSLKKFTLTGSYTYTIATSSSLTNVLDLDISGDCPRLCLYGFLIRYFLNIKNNYFGEFQHFKTLEEFKETLTAKGPSSTKNSVDSPSKSNRLDIMIHIRGDRPNVILPASIYGNDDNLDIRATCLECDIRFTNFYMDIELFFSPLEAALDSRDTNDSRTTSSPQCIVDGLRLYGHRIFGLPPTEPTYVCNWDFDVGKVMGECTPAFLKCATTAVKFVGFSIDDEENALPSARPPILHDVTLVRTRVHSVNIWVVVENAAVLLNTSAINLDFNDWAGNKFSDCLNLAIASFTFSVVDYKYVSQQQETTRPITTYAYFQTGIDLQKVNRKYDFHANRALQQQHVRIHDHASKRAQFFLRAEDDVGLSAENLRKSKNNPTTMPLPSIPQPARGMDFRKPPSSGSSSWASRRATPQEDQYVDWQKGPGDVPNLTLPRLMDGLSHTTQIPSEWRLHGVQPDLDLVPLLPSPRELSGGAKLSGDEIPLTSTLKSQNDMQAYVLCELSAGLKGFCSPEAVFALSSLVDKLQPSRPIEIIDSLQARVVSDIVGHEKRLSKKPKQNFTASLRIPICRVKFLSHPISSDERRFRDEFYVELRRVRTLYRKRSETKNHEVQPIQLGLATHTSIGSVSLSVQTENVNGLDQEDIFSSKVDEVVFWSMSGDQKRSRLQMQNLEGITSDKSVEGLALLVERTKDLVDSMVVSLKRTSKNQEGRLHHMIYSLTQNGSQTSDPLFLTRPSYVLRTTNDHLRANDSWKIVSQFRNIYNSLRQDQKAWLATQCTENTFTFPSDACSFVLYNFDRWRSWDVAHVKKSYIMKVVWGEQELSNWNNLDSSADSMSVSIQTLRLSVDPGPKENGLLIEDLSICVDHNSGMVETTSSTSSSTSIQSYCSNAALYLKWEILQLAERIFKTMSKPKNTPHSNQISQEPKATASRNGRRDFQLVFVSRTGTIELESINLKLNLGGDCFKGSVIHQRPPGLSSPKMLNVIVASDSSSIELSSRSSPLMQWKLQTPNVFVSRASERNGGRSEHDWKCATGCQRLQFDMVEDALGLIHVADLVVEDELRHILDISTSLSSPATGDTASEQRDIHNFRVAAFLNDYQLRIALLPTISYFFSGEAASLSVVPAPELKVEVDFDVKNNLHVLQSEKDGVQRIISSLAGPPVNGRITIDSLHNRTSFDVDVTVELIQVEAGAVRNLLAAMNGPEISHFVSDINHDAQNLQHRLDLVLSRDSLSSSSKKAESSRELAYKLRLTLAGIHIHSTAQGLRNADYSVGLDFNFGLTQVHLENAPKNGTILENPNFDLNVHQVKFGIQKREGERVQSYGSVVLYARVSGSSGTNEKGESTRSYQLSSDGLEIELFAETASMMVDIVAHLQEKLKSIDLSNEVKHLRKLRHKKKPERSPKPQLPQIETPDQRDHKKLFDAMYSVVLANIQVTWLISAKDNTNMEADTEDLVFSTRRIEVATKRDNAARLRLEDMQLQMIPAHEAKKQRSHNSALLPEVVFNVAYLSTNEERRFAFQAAGKALDIRLTSDFILPASLLQNSLASASEKLREANALWATSFSPEQKQKQFKPSIKRLGSLLIDSDFAGAVVSLQSRRGDRMHDTFRRRGQQTNTGGKYGRYAPPNEAATAKVEAPGVALKVQFEDTGTQNPTLNAELKVDASTNVLYPSVVPLITQISSSVKEVVGDDETDKQSAKEKRSEKTQALQERAIGANDPTTILGRCQLNIGIRICRQEFTLSCQPITRVIATARFDDFYMTVNTVQSEEKRRFFAVLVALDSIQTSIKHVYSSDATASFDVDSIVMSLMNSKHVSTTAGISAILKVSPTKVYGNVKQAQDFLLFREIWLARDGQPSRPRASAISSPEAQTYVVQRYRQVAATSAFPWDSTFAVEELRIQLDLGQTVGKSDLTIRNLWLSSKKSSDWEQNLCFGFDTIAVESKGRLSGFVELSRVKLRTSIMWPDEEPTERETPLIQASLGFGQLQAKVSFEYEPFLVADVTSFEFLMYNVRQSSDEPNDRLVSILDGAKIQVFCTALTASQTLALYQTLQRLVQDKQAAFDTSLKEIENFLRRNASSSAGEATQQPPSDEATGKNEVDEGDEDANMPISLHTDVMVNLQAINIGAFPSTFHDSQVFKLEAHDADARFSVAAADGRIHGGLGLTLGQLRVGLSSISRVTEPGPEDLTVSDVVSRATDSRGGTILRVPRVLASMDTWQTPSSRDIDYIFKSAFEGRVDVGWNYSRISFIRGMWTNHSRALATRLGKPLPKPAVQITGGPKEGDEGEHSGGEKITAVVDVPQSRYTYTALEPPVIETPQLRDMGEATPPLEWIGLHRDKLPNLTHQIIMVTLMEVAKDVEDAYSKILGS